MADEKKNLGYAMMAMVAIVAIVAIFVLFTNKEVKNTATVDLENENVAGDMRAVGRYDCDALENVCESSREFYQRCDPAGTFSGAGGTEIQEWNCGCYGSAGLLWSRPCI